jgi:hypothetical protein
MPSLRSLRARMNEALQKEREMSRKIQDPFSPRSAVSEYTSDRVFDGTRPLTDGQKKELARIYGTFVANEQAAEAARLAVFADALRKWWSFDDRQFHTHIATRLPDLLREYAKAEVTMWEDRWKAERADHERTIDECDKATRGEP